MGSFTETATLPAKSDTTRSWIHREKVPKSLNSSYRPIDETFSRVPAADIDDVPGTLPEAQIDDGVDLEGVAKDALSGLIVGDTDFLEENVLWRDVFALTGTLRTFHSRTTASAAWSDLRQLHRPQDLALKPGTAKVKRTDSTHSWVHVGFTFATGGDIPMQCSGWVGLVPRGDSWKIWLLCTVLEEITGLGSPDVLSSTHSPSKCNAYFNDVQNCVIVGAGFGGLCVAGRMKALEIDCLVIDQQKKIGDNWLDRYDSARFHTSKYFSEMPVERVFDDTYDYFLSARELAKGYQTYVDRLAINVMLSTILRGAKYDALTGLWSLQVERLGNSFTIQTRHVVLAIGAGSGQIPQMPTLPGREKFKGTVLHSKYYKNCHEWKGLKGVVIGTANTAHDVAEDMLEAGLSEVTMVQRGATPVFPIQYYSKWADPIYNASGSIEDADRAIMVSPIVVTRLTTQFGMRAQAATEPERFNALERAGFKLDRSLDLWKCLTKRNGGHYMDVGASAKIAEGLVSVALCHRVGANVQKIRIKSDAALTEYREGGLSFSDGSQLEADVVIFCTGFSNEYRNEAIKLVGDSGADKLDDYWLLDREGELRGAYKRQGYPGMWYTGGGVTHARFYSRFIALQIKAEMNGTPLPMYKKRHGASTLEA